MDRPLIYYCSKVCSGQGPSLVAAAMHCFWKSGVKGCLEGPRFNPKTLKFPAGCHDVSAAATPSSFKLNLFSYIAHNIAIIWLSENRPDDAKMFTANTKSENLF